MPGGATEFLALDLLTLPQTYSESPSDWFEDFWYKYTPILEGAMGCRASLTAGTNFDPKIEVFYGTPGALDDWYFLIAPDTRPATVPTFVGETLYFRVVGDSNMGSTAGVALQVAFYKAPKRSIQVGDIFIPDDTAFEYPEASGTFHGFPGSILNPDDGTVRRLQKRIPASESGDTLIDGSVLLDNSADSSQLHLFGNALTLRTLVAPPVAFGSGVNIHHVTRYDDTHFAVVSKDGSTHRLWTVDRTGEIFGVDTWTLPGSSQAGIGVNATAQIVYHGLGTVSAAVRRYDLAADTALSDLAAGVTGYTIVEDSIIVLEDETILVGYRKTTPRDAFIRQYDPTGTILNTYAIGGDPLVLDRICRALDSPTTFVAWIHEFITPNETSRFRFVDVATGTYVELAPVYQSNAGVGPLLDDPPLFGHSFSCPIMVLLGCACPPRPDWGGGRGYSGGYRNPGDDPRRELSPFDAECVFGGTVPDGVDGSDTENWAD